MKIVLFNFYIFAKLLTLWSIFLYFLFKVFFEFGEFFCAAVETLYNNANCSIKLKHGTTSRFYLKIGIRQGCPISPYIFLLVTQLLSMQVKNKKVLLMVSQLQIDKLL